MKINPCKIKAIRLTRARVKIPLGYSFVTKKNISKRAVVNTWK
jgi:hypothetical protein